MQVIKDEKMEDNAETMGKLFREEIKKLNSPFIELIRGKGLLNAIVMKHKNPDASWALCLSLKENGLLAKPTHGDKIRFAPPLIINRDQILEAVRIIEKSLATL
jgi:ornithine--oxo-acid transaminase